MKIQLTLRESVPVEKALIEHIEKCGPRSGEAKRLLLVGYTNDSAPTDDKGRSQPPAAKQ